MNEIIDSVEEQKASSPHEDFLRKHLHNNVREDVRKIFDKKMQQDKTSPMPTGVDESAWAEYCGAIFDLVFDRYHHYDGKPIWTQNEYNEKTQALEEAFPGPKHDAEAWFTQVAAHAIDAVMQERTQGDRGIKITTGRMNEKALFDPAGKPILPHQRVIDALHVAASDATHTGMILFQRHEALINEFSELEKELKQTLDDIELRCNNYKVKKEELLSVIEITLKDREVNSEDLSAQCKNALLSPILIPAVIKYILLSKYIYQLRETAIEVIESPRSDQDWAKKPDAEQLKREFWDAMAPQQAALDSLIKKYMHNDPPPSFSELRANFEVKAEEILIAYATRDTGREAARSV